MSDTDLGTMDASALAARYAAGEASPLEATGAALERIERFNSAVNAYTYVDAEGAEAAARASTRRWRQGAPLSPIDGVPVSLKDLTEVAGMPAREGSRMSPATKRQQDAPPARMLREAGAILLGKTNTPEFGWKAVTDNLVHGTTYNPWDTRLTPGGSSGGAAVAAALNMGVLHQGGDSGGSIRIPAAFTGVFGFKPSFGWTPQWPPSKEPSLSHIGPLTRNVRDAAHMLNVIGRYDFRDPYAIRGQPDDWGSNLANRLDGLRIAYSPDLGYARVDEQVTRRVRQAAETLQSLGAVVEEVNPGFASPVETFKTMWFTASLELWLQCSERERELLDPGLVANAKRAEALSAVDYFRALADRARLTERLEHFNQDYHLLMTPTVPIEPFAAHHEVPPESDMQDWEEWAPFSYPFNLSQQPAASVPCGFTDTGLPVGFQLAGGKFDDVRILHASHAYLEVCPPRFPSEPNPAQVS
ncbi:amidase [Halomonas korlensis]|uniref:Aspartyl-tRNA(Asn)/glutamyl-tRNA(Gln) amidotransferase subunit A n=1 Tax=Halomonas korlensis TaxID=463301 RepID=A0A1I7FX43_9GAMM|nr:amidase [Halomonas korlensis]SFU40713.1 aspartyl-tRNA(Asn)/glutamyl-tRNA(Gln) amidotransferase subunit A [Halomonas korlensis]